VVSKDGTPYPGWGIGRRKREKGPFFIKIESENPVLWTGMKSASAEGRKKSNQMLKRVQHDNRVGSLFCHPGPCPELDSGLFRDLDLRSREFWF
jgi:hypothetical protein